MSENTVNTTTAADNAPIDPLSLAFELAAMLPDDPEKAENILTLAERLTDAIVAAGNDSLRSILEGLMLGFFIDQSDETTAVVAALLGK